MILAGFDLETTGFVGSKDHVVQYSFQLWNAVECLTDETHLCDPGVPIENSEIHGVTDEIVAGAVSERDALISIDSLFRACFQNHIPVVIMNAAFDVTFYRDALRHHYEIEPTSDFLIVDPMVIDKQMDKWRPGKRKLIDLCKTYGVGISEGFHDAWVDVRASIKLARIMLTKFGLDGGFAKLHSAQVMWYYQQQKSLYEYFVSTDNEAQHTVGVGWPINHGLMEMVLCGS